MFLIYPSSDATEAVFAKLVLVRSASAMRSVVAVVVVVVVVRSAPVAGCSSGPLHQQSPTSHSAAALGATPPHHAPTQGPGQQTQGTQERREMYL